MRPKRSHAFFLVAFLSAVMAILFYTQQQRADWTFDNEPPETTISPSITYTSSSANIPLQCDDRFSDSSAGAGCLAVYYQEKPTSSSCDSNTLSGTYDYNTSFPTYNKTRIAPLFGEQPSYPPVVNVTVNSPAGKSICYFSVDNAGNIERPVERDDLNPTCTGNGHIGGKKILIDTNGVILSSSFNPAGTSVSLLDGPAVVAGPDTQEPFDMGNPTGKTTYQLSVPTLSGYTVKYCGTNNDNCNYSYDSSTNIARVDPTVDTGTATPANLDNTCGKNVDIWFLYTATATPTPSPTPTTPAGPRYYISGTLYKDADNDNTPDLGEQLPNGGYVTVNGVNYYANGLGVYNTGSVFTAGTYNVRVTFNAPPLTSAGYVQPPGSDTFTVTVGPSCTSPPGGSPFAICTTAFGPITAGNVSALHFIMKDEWVANPTPGVCDTSGNIQLRWDPHPSSSLSYYNIVITTAPGSPFRVNAPTTLYNATSLPPRTYTWYVEAKTSVGVLIGTSPTASFTCPPLTTSWFQGIGGDLRIDEPNAGFTDDVPSGDYISKLLLPSSTTPGVIYSGLQAITTPPSGRISTTDWKVMGLPPAGGINDFSYKGKRSTAYQTIRETAKRNGVTPPIFYGPCTTASGCDIADYIKTNDPSGLINVYEFGGDVSVTSTTFDANRNYIILVSGELIIKNDIDINNNEFVLFAVRGNIIVEETVDTVEGFYSTDTTFRTLAASPCRNTSLTIEGVVIANAKPGNGGIYDHQRCKNDNQPAVIFKERPDLILRTPDFLRVQGAVWQEVAP